MTQVDNDQIKGVWVVAKQKDMYVLCQEADRPNGNKPRFGKQPLDHFIGVAETRKQGESIMDNIRRAMIEELGLKEGYQVVNDNRGLLNVDCFGGEFFVRVADVILDENIDVGTLKPEDSDTIIIGLVDESGLFKRKPHRAGSEQALKLITGALGSEEIVQAVRYE